MTATDMEWAKPLAAEEAAKLFAPLGRYRRLALAVSGGPDSLALLHLLQRWRQSSGSGPDLTVLTVDHGLRAQSRDEALMVARIAAGLDVPHAVLSWHAPAKLRAVQASARQARYDLMAEYCHRHGIPAIATAHHLDDQAETFLMRLTRGSGLDGLAAIPERSSWAGIAVLRPLLNVPKTRLVASLIAEGASWVEDPSNDDPRFERARIRASRDGFAALGLTPEAVARSAQRLRRARAALDHAAEQVLAAHGSISAAGYGVLQRDALSSAPDEIALRVLAKIIETVGAREVPIRLSKLEVLLDALRAMPAKTHTLGGCRIEPHAKGIGVFRETRGSGLPALRLSPGERTLWDNRFRIALADDATGEFTVRALGEAGFRDARSSSAWLASLPRRACVTLPACWRDDELIAVPDLSDAAMRSARSGQPVFYAEFVNAGFFPEMTRLGVTR